EPGLRDRGHVADGLLYSLVRDRPQWSPVFATGVTRPARSRRPPSTRRRNGARSSRPGSHRAGRSTAPEGGIEPMEPGLRDRGHLIPPELPLTNVTWAAMEPGLRDRGHPEAVGMGFVLIRGRNGARSSRPGSPDLALEVAEHADWAAMEPGLRDRG